MNRPAHASAALPPSSPPPPAARVVDMHVHAVGDGSAGSGCVYRPRAWRWPLEAFMARHIGLPVRTLRGGLDRPYVDRLLHWVRTSPLDAVVLLAHEQVYDDAGRVAADPGPLHVPNAYVLRLGREHPEFLPGVSIHPARPDALDELERCLAGGAVLLKCLPNCQNLDPCRPQYRRFWERMAAAGLPLLAHTGGEHTLPVVRPELADPRVLRLPLECGVTVIAAHCGTRSGLVDPDYFEVFAGLVRAYPNLYGDVSAFNLPFRSRAVPACLRPPLGERLVHGSDFPVPIFGHWAWGRRLVTWADFRRAQREPNPLKRDYQLKRAMGFPPETFTRINRLLRPAAASPAASPAPPPR